MRVQCQEAFKGRKQIVDGISANTLSASQLQKLQINTGPNSHHSHQPGSEKYLA